jgi:phage N-6-adenine-methyltransferase
VSAQVPVVGTVWRTAGMSSSLRTEWATPWRIFEMLNAEFHFDLDVCASAATATVPRFFEWGALDLPWGRRVWCHPPYGRGIGRWVEKGFRESRMGSLVVMLLPARTDTQWFHDYCLHGEIRFLRGRLCFDDRPNRIGRCPFPSMLVIFGNTAPMFTRHPESAGEEREVPLVVEVIRDLEVL